MKMTVHLGKNERLTNFKLAEAVWEFCEDNANDLDADTIAKMILVQGEREDEECFAAPNKAGFI